MNYLAHLYLSHPNGELMTGNFIADSVKGHHFNDYPSGIKTGIIMHRAIDDFTDHHPIVIECKKIFSAQYDKYSGVLIDVYFDYLLAKNFSSYSAIPLSEFAEQTYKTLALYQGFFPVNAARFFGYMTKENILFRYADMNGIEQVLKGLTYRIKNRMLLQESIDSFRKNELFLEENFFRFFEEIKGKGNFSDR